MNENDERREQIRVLQKWEKSGLLDGLPTGSRDVHASLLENQVKLYQVPIKDEDGKDAILQVQEKVYELLAKKLRETAQALMPAAMPAPVRLHRPFEYFEPSFVWAPYIPVHKPPEIDADIKLSISKKVITRYAKKCVNPNFFGKITFPQIKDVTSPEIRKVFTEELAKEIASVQQIEPGIYDHLVEAAKMTNFGNPCGEIMIDAVISTENRSIGPTVIADPSKYPHKCPKCGAPAYVGFASVDCSRKSCP